MAKQKRTYLENNKVTLSEGEEKAFQLLTISRFILARTPMVLGYSQHSEIIGRLSLMIKEISYKSSDHDKVVESQEWKEIQKILNI